MKHVRLCMRFFFLLMVSQAHSQSGSIWAENQEILTDNKFTAVGKLQGQYLPKGKTIGYHGFALVNSNKWGQVVMGITVQPKFKKLDAFNLTLAGGMEIARIPLRLQTSLYLQKKFFSNYVAIEYGGGGYWFFDKLLFRVHRNFQMGVYVERGVGLGPLVVFEESFVQFWVSPAYDFERKQWSGTFAVNVYFSWGK